MAMGAGGGNPFQRYDQYGRVIGAAEPGGQNYAGPATPAPASAPPAQPIIQGGPDPNLHPLGPVGGPQATPPSTAVTGAMNSGLDAVLAQINKTFDANKGEQNAEAQRLMANRGLGRTDAAGQGINAGVMGKFEGARSAAIMQAMLQDQNSQEQKRQFDAQLALHQQQAQMAQQAQQANMAWQQQQQNWQREDRTRELANSGLQTQLQQTQLQNQLNSARNPAPFVGTAGPLSTQPAPVANPGVSNGGESFAETMARFGYGGASPAASAVGGAMSGGPPLGAGSGPGDTLNAGSSAGLNADGSWRHPGSYNPNGTPRTQFAPNSTVGTAGPSSAGVGGNANSVGGGVGVNPGVAGYNTQPGMRTNPNSLSK